MSVIALILHRLRVDPKVIEFLIQENKSRPAPSRTRPIKKKSSKSNTLASSNKMTLIAILQQQQPEWPDDKLPLVAAKQLEVTS